VWAGPIVRTCKDIPSSTFKAFHPQGRVWAWAGAFNSLVYPFPCHETLQKSDGTSSGINQIVA
jgi:hypothetical protein